MPTTSNFGWTTPADTDLVKDGAAAIRTLGNGIDTSLVDLKGGTTGQILSKNSNTDLDYIWINNDQGDITAVTAGTGLTGGGTTGAVTLTNDMATTITASGDIVVGTGSGTYDNLPIGTTGQVLTADTTVSPYKVKWATPASGSTFVGVSVYQANLQTIANNTATALTFTSENYDTDGFHSTVTNTSRLTVPSGKGGYYEIKMQGYWDQSATGIRQARLYKNGAVLMYSGDFETDDATAYVPSMVSMVTNLAVGDYIEFYVYQTSGGNLSFFRYIDSFVGTMTYLGA